MSDMSDDRPSSEAVIEAWAVLWASYIRSLATEAEEREEAA
jgi:hypothetical protein